MSQLEKKLNALLESPVSASGYELLGVEFVRAGKHSTLRLYIDGPNGVEIDDCVEVSRQVSAVLDVEDPISTEYNLEVSSPGLDRPLFKPKHYQEAVGKVITAKTQLPQDNRRNFKGVVESCEENSFSINCDNTSFTIAYDNVLKANLVPEFD